MQRGGLCLRMLTPLLLATVLLLPSPISSLRGVEVSYDTFVPAQTAVISKLDWEFDGKPSSSFVVEYQDEFCCKEAREAFKFALKLMSLAVFGAKVPIVIHASMQSLSHGELGNARPLRFRRRLDVPGVDPTIWYPEALANELSGKDVSKDEPEIIATFNSDADWSFAIDGQPRSGKYDFVTVVMHEMVHGLAAASTFELEGGGLGWGKNTDAPSIWDTFLHTASRKQLINTGLFMNPSGSLLRAATREVQWGASGVTLWSPPGWDPAASLTHLDEASHPPGARNSLMTPALGRGEVIHDIGPIALCMLHRLGWPVIASFAESCEDLLPNSAETRNSDTVLNWTPKYNKKTAKATTKLKLKKRAADLDGLMSHCPAVMSSVGSAPVETISFKARSSGPHLIRFLSSQQVALSLRHTDNDVEVMCSVCSYCGISADLEQGREYGVVLVTVADRAPKKVKGKLSIVQSASKKTSCSKKQVKRKCPKT